LDIGFFGQGWPLKIKKALNASFEFFTQQTIC
jgi:hypothetical protein